MLPVRALELDGVLQDAIQAGDLLLPPTKASPCIATVKSRGSCRNINGRPNSMLARRVPKSARSFPQRRPSPRNPLGGLT